MLWNIQFVNFDYNNDGLDHYQYKFLGYDDITSKFVGKTFN